MPSFKGFPAGKIRFTRVPATFFTELLPHVDQLGELKVTLYALWRLDRMEGAFRYLCEADFAADETFMQGMGPDAKKALSALRTGLKQAVARGTLLESTVELEAGRTRFYFLNTARGQAAVKAIAAGEWQPSGDPQAPLSLNMERPNIFRLYEEHIGALTPMLSERLGEAEDTYPPTWIEEAFRLAVENNVRRWSYVDAILRRWNEEGRDERPKTHRGDSEKDRRKYVEGEFSDFIEH
ncbi:MAG: DnaD domain protein [Anaerolineae bacterium]|nr:DnaD domain protein [Anaerolineae bacterium]